MQRQRSERVAEALGVLALMHPNAIAPAAADLMVQDLSRYPEEDVLTALEKCRLSLARFPTTAEIVSRLPGYGPAVDEAWALIPKDERTSFFWTDDMAAAYGVARELLRRKDETGARLAFREAYTNLVDAKRMVGIKSRWVPCLGTDPDDRCRVLLDGEKRGLITRERARMLESRIEDREQKLLEGAVIEQDPGEARAGMAAMSEIITRLETKLTRAEKIRIWARGTFRGKSKEKSR